MVASERYPGPGGPALQNVFTFKIEDNLGRKHRFSCGTLPHCHAACFGRCACPGSNAIVREARLPAIALAITATRVPK